jgi:hypothetical protein
MLSIYFQIILIFVYIDILCVQFVKLINSLNSSSSSSYCLCLPTYLKNSLKQYFIFIWLSTGRTFCGRKFCRGGRFVEEDDLYRWTFCGRTLCGRMLCGRTFCREDVL